MSFKTILAAALLFMAASANAAIAPLTCRTGNASGFFGFSTAGSGTHNGLAYDKSYVANVDGGKGFYVGGGKQGFMYSNAENFCYGKYEFVVKVMPKPASGGWVFGPWPYRVQRSGDTRVTELDAEFVTNRSGQVHWASYPANWEAWTNASECWGQKCTVTMDVFKTQTKFYINGNLRATGPTPPYPARVNFWASSNFFGVTAPATKTLAGVWYSFKYTYRKE